MNTEKFVVGIRRQLLRNKRNYFACCPNVKTNSCMEMNVLNSHRNIFKAFITNWTPLKKGVSLPFC